MCGRYAYILPHEAMRQLFRLSGALPSLPPRYNVAPGERVPVIRLEGGERRVALLQWGLIPHWAKTPPSPPPPNARGETIDEKPTFREAFKKHRCLMPASGFFEWQETPGQRRKQPFYVPRADGAPYAMAAIWESWTASGGEILETVAIITCEANESLKAVHHRMPVILDPAVWDAWLDPASHPRAMKALLAPPAEDVMAAHAVSLDVNRAANDSPALIEPVFPAAPPPEVPKLRKTRGNTRSKSQLDLF